jgi:cytochrome c biogenesis protein CcmG/thiol:disulfide interchange protein DsbE
MMNRMRFDRAAQSYSILILLLVAGVTSSLAAATPDSSTAVQAMLPDSLSLKGKVVYVDFWASWCVPCRQSFPWMQKMHEKYQADGLEVVAVNVDKNRSSADKFLDQHKVTFPVVFDSSKSMAKLYQLDAMPSSFLYGRDGSLVARYQGFREEETDSLDAAIRGLLKKEDSE